LLLEQYWRDDHIGELSNWILEQDFEPIEFHDILERVTDDNLKSSAIDSLVEYATTVIDDKTVLKIIDEMEIDKERLKIAIRNERFEEAAVLRDKFQSNCESVKAATLSHEILTD
jgi:hypothetical protein